MQVLAKILKKSGALLIGVKGLDSSSSSSSSRSYSSYIYNIRDPPLIYKDKLIVLSLQVFPFWDDLTLWDSFDRD